MFFEKSFFTLTGFDFYVGLFLFFSILSIIGWFIEMMYLATSGRGLINSGFLQGPFCPAYATGGLVIYLLTYLMIGVPLIIQLLIYAILCSVIEYIASFSLEMIMGIRIWDYSDEFGNLHGRISIKYTFFWFLLVTIVILFIQPGVITFIEYLSPKTRNILAIAFLIIYPLDIIFSAYIYNKLSDTVNKICIKFNLPLKEMHNLQFNRPRIMKEKKRIKKLFKDPEYAELNKKIEDSLFNEESFKNFKLLNEHANDIIEHPKYKEWINSTEKSKYLYYRYLRIAELASRFAESLNLDVRAVIRGTLLSVYKANVSTIHHKIWNFFFPQYRILYFIHNDLFKIKGKERDIVLRYKWPLNFSAPLYKECICVSFAEKIVQSLEHRKVLKSLYENYIK